MNFYETVVILQDSSLQSIETAVEECKNILLSMGAKLVRYEDWGARNFAYPIKRNKRGHYIALLSEADPAAITELERQFKIKNNILRFLTLRLKKINSKDFSIKYQVVDTRNKTKFFVTENNSLIPVRPSGALYNIQIVKSIDKYIQSFKDTYKNLKELYNISKFHKYHQLVIKSLISY